ncbi:MAG: hypothetical protein WKF75_07260 [Singulisphaera sp.]
MANTLGLTAAGRKALGQPPHAARLWRKWLGTTAFDEFHRVEAVGGPARGGLTAARPSGARWWSRLSGSARSVGGSPSTSCAGSCVPRGGTSR